MNLGSAARKSILGLLAALFLTACSGGGGGGIPTSPSPTNYTVNFLAGSGGTISGTPTQTVISGGSTLIVTAIPNPGFAFTNWTSSGLVTTNSNPLVVSNVTSNLTITANFTPQPATYTETFLAGSGGHLNGTVNQTVVSGGSTSAVTAVANAGYAFVNWTGSGFTTTTSNPLVVSNVTSNLTITANFTPQPTSYSVNFLASVGGTLIGTTTQTVASGGSTAPVAAVPNSGYTFTNWSGSGFATTTSNPLVATNVTSDLTITASFTPQLASYTVTFQVGSGGHLNGTVNQTVVSGGSTSAVTAVANASYAFANWTGSGFTTTASNPLVVSNVTSNLTITANFTPQPTSYSVTFLAGAGGTLTGATTQTVASGGSTSLVIAVPNSGYSFTNWSGSGFATTSSNPLMVTNVTSDLTITANFTPQPTSYTVTFQAGGGGHLTGTAIQNVMPGGSTTAVTAVPNTGYSFANWTGGGFTTSTANPLTVPNVTSNLTVTANFVPQTFTVTFQAGTGGTVTGTATQTVAYGGSTASVSAVPNTGYSFANWTGGGLTTSTANPLTVLNVASNLTVTANFTPQPTSYSVTFLAGSGGSLTGTTTQTVASGGGTTAVTAVPNPGYVFTNWTGSGFLANTSNPLLVANVTSDLSITANFNPSTPATALNINGMLGAALATITTSTLDIGAAQDMFDGSTSTLARSANVNPMIVLLSFTTAQTIREFRLYCSNAFGTPAYQWKVETAGSQVDLDTKTGTYLLAVPTTPMPSDAWSNAPLSSSIAAKFIKLTVTRLTGDGYVHINEWTILGDPAPGAYSISGKISGAVTTGVQVNLSGPASRTTLTDGTGNFTFTGLDFGTYRVTPSQAGYVFSPNGLQVVIGSGSVTNQNMLSWATPTVVDEPVPSSLSTPASGAITTIPVIVLRYLPSNDGVSLDTTRAADFWSRGEITLTDLKRNIDAYNIRGKFMLEEGSRFRGYKDAAAKPYLGYKVLKSWTIIGQVPISPVFASPVRVSGYLLRRPDFMQIAQDFDFKHYVEDLGVKEIWIWFGATALPSWPSYDPTLDKPELFVEGPESNMSSPTTGDISNSYRDPDLPIFSKTYVVYCYNFRRTQAEMVHDHGHQLESILNYAAQRQDGNSNLFVRDFSGWGANYSTPPLGRAGDTHHPPNTQTDYDYLNATPVSSDIEDWRPDNSGVKKLVNADTWGNLTYPWPTTAIPIQQQTESQWYIYWMQNMPGYLNSIPYQSKIMSNWWIFTADWDTAIQGGKGLHQ